MLFDFIRATIVLLISFMNCNFEALSKFWMENTPLNWHYKYYIWMFSFLHALRLHKSNSCVAYFFHELQFWALSKFRMENTPLNWQCIWMFSFLHALGLHKRNICVAHFFHELQFWNLKKILNGKYSIKLVSQILHSNGFYFFRLLINKAVFTRVTFELHISFMNWNI